ncbi:MAG: rod shape-determining protein MreC [Candidatus Falkowbacteria bacterium]
MAFYSKKNKNWIWALAFSLVIFLHFTKILAPLENLAIFSAKPLAGFLYGSGSGIRKSYEASQQQKDVFSKVSSLEQEVARLTVENAQFKEVAQDNLKLRSQLSFLSANKYKNILANVISQNLVFDIKEGDQDIVIDKGSKDGIKEDLGVINENGVIIGKVSEVRDNISKICLTTNSNCKFAATIQNNDRTMGITEGDLGLTIKMNYIPQSEKINLNDTVITSGLGGNIARGLVIGKVSQINNKSNEIWQDVNIEPLFDLNTLTIVTVLTP